jgi:hypothetical protein
LIRSRGAIGSDVEIRVDAKFGSSSVMAVKIWPEAHEESHALDGTRLVCHWMKLLAVNVNVTCTVRSLTSPEN